MPLPFSFRSTPPRATTLATLFVAATIACTSCAPGGSGGSGPLDNVDLGGEEPDDIGGGGQTGVLTIVYPETYRFAPVGTALEELVPELSDQVDSFEVAPALPAGLTIDQGTGAISGTPAAAAPRRTYTVTAFNEFGSAQTRVVLELPGVPRFAYVSSAFDSTLSIYSIDTFSGRLQHRGLSPAAPFQEQPEMMAVHPTAAWLYLANEETATLGTLSIDATTGVLTPVDTDAIGHGPYGLEVHPDGAFVYVVSNQVGTLRGFRIDPQTGALEQTGPSVITPSDPVGLMLAPNGNYLVTLHGSPAMLASYRIDTASGQLFLAQELELEAGSQPLGGAISPDSEHAYLTLADAESALHLTIDPFSAQMSAGETQPTQIEPHRLLLRAQGDFAYVVNENSAENGGPVVSVYAVDPASGALGAPEDVPLGLHPESASLSTDGALLCVLDRGARQLTTWAIDELTGLPAPRAAARTRQLSSAVAIVSGDAATVVRPGQLYVGGAESGELTVLTVDPEGGGLDALGAPIQTGARIRALEVDPLLRYLWVADASPGGPSLRVMELDEEGLPSPLHQALFGVRPVAIAAGPAARHVYVATDDLDNGLFALEIQADGTLVNIDYAQVGFSPAAVEIDPTGQFLYVANSAVEQPGDQGDLAMFRLDPATGELTPLLPDAFAGGAPVAIAFSAVGDRAYSAFANGDKIGLYEIDAADGMLELVLQATDTGPRPRDLVLTPNGLHGYAAISDPQASGHVELYDVRPEDGLLYDATTGEPEARASFLAGAQPSALELAPAGDRLYVLNRTSATVTTFAVSALNGDLTPLDLDAVGPNPGAMAASIVVE